MFDKLVVSTLQKRSRRTVKFFVCTSITYLFVIAAAFVLSIYLASPKLADSGVYILKLVGTVSPPPPPIINPASDSAGETSVPDFRNPRTFDELSQQETLPPRINPTRGLPDTGQIGGLTNGDPNGSPYGTGDNPGIIGGDGKASDAPPRPPDPPKPAPRSVETDNKPLRVPSIVLQGKVIERRVPIYPELARRIRLQGDVAVEVIIAPEGRVESVRAVSGHPMLTQSALDAARIWRFAPTLLNGVPVRVTGVITFVFKLNE
jgi:protein TonB